MVRIFTRLLMCLYYISLDRTKNYIVTTFLKSPRVEIVIKRTFPVFFLSILIFLWFNLNKVKADNCMVPGIHLKLLYFVKRHTAKQ